MWAAATGLTTRTPTQCGDCPQPWVTKDNCAAALRAYGVNTTSPFINRVLLCVGKPGPLRRACTPGGRAAHRPERLRCARASFLTRYGFSPGSCHGVNPADLTDVEADVANFLLTRGEFAFLGNGWTGCERPATRLSVPHTRAARVVAAVPRAPGSHGRRACTRLQVRTSTSSPASGLTATTARRPAAQRRPRRVSLCANGPRPRFRWTAIRGHPPSRFGRDRRRSGVQRLARWEFRHAIHITHRPTRGELPFWPRARAQPRVRGPISKNAGL